MLNFNYVTGANVYINDNEQYGRAMEVSGLDVKTVKVDHNPIGMFGKKKIIIGLDTIELDVTFDFIHESMTLNDRFDFAIKGNVVRDENGVKREFATVIECSGLLDNNNLLGSGVKHQEWKGQKVKLTIDYLKVEYDGQELMEIDVDNNIWVENGVDKLEQMRTNAGL